MDESTKKITRLFVGLRHNKSYAIKASFLCLLFWLLQFLYQHYFLNASFNQSLIRSFSFSGATLISLSLLIGPVARLTNFNFVFHRRAVGVWGFTFIILHFLAVYDFVLKFNISGLLWNTNPFVNLLLLGLVGFVIFIPLYLTSTDWALIRLGIRKWKFIHRLAYFAYIFAVLHYLNTNPAAMTSLAGRLLLIATGLVVLLQIIGFLKTIRKTRRKKDLVIGIIIILIGVALFYIVYTTARG
ncbi:MAG: ferric reductase-like transmembrane domain-containing protein [Candidatus Aenigmarchaeota archaeon]|nr:ferric reductase-like transmembrane domain-containing protein [Candidatus Aenigmarchaeota archaeon]